MTAPLTESDHRRIEQLGRWYCQGLDSRDWSLWDGVFTDDAVLDLTPMGGSRQSPHQMQQRLGTDDPRRLFAQHLVINLVVLGDGDRVVALSEYLLETGRRTEEPGLITRVSGGGSYRDEVVRTPDGWRIAERRIWLKWQRTTVVEDEINR